jgi:hypothetical protein
MFSTHRKGVLNNYNPPSPFRGFGAAGLTPG